MTTHTAALTRREADRKGYLDCRRAAEAMRADAAFFRDLAAGTVPEPAVYGTRAQDYRDGVVARLELVAGWAEAEAVRQDGYAEGYRSLLGVEDDAS